MDLEKMDHKNHNEFYDCVYIIHLDKNRDNLEKINHQMKQHQFSNYKIMNAVYTHDPFYKLFYEKLCEKIINKYSKEYIDHNFQRGALGCYLSHVNCIMDAKLNKYSRILILEEDFVIIRNYNDEIKCLIQNLPDDWDLVYFGKKQLKLENAHKINDSIYLSDKNTYATHALYLKDTIFNEIIKQSESIDGAIDLELHNLQSTKKIYAVYKDLFISDDRDTDIQTNLEYKKETTWGWDMTLYNRINTIHIENIVIFGFKKDKHHTHHYMHHMYFKFFTYYYKNIQVHFYDENELNDSLRLNNSIIFCSPTHRKYSKYILGKNNHYIFHLDNFKDNIGYNTIDGFFVDSQIQELIKTIHYTTLLCREKCSTNQLKYFESNVMEKEICLPWFTDTLLSDIKKIDTHMLYNKIREKKYYAYIGSIWKDNIEIIKTLIRVCLDHNIRLLLRGRVFGLDQKDNKYLNSFKENSPVLFEPFDYKNNENNSFENINKKHDIKHMISLQGENKQHYMTNRIYENLLLGSVAITNSEIVKQIFDSVIFFRNDYNGIHDMFKYLDIVYSNEKMYSYLLNRQINEFILKLYGYNTIVHLFGFLKKVELNNNTLLKISHPKPFKLWLCSDNKYTNTYFKKIVSERDLLDLFKHPQDAMITNSDYNTHDKFLILQLISNSVCDFYIDSGFEYYEEVIQFCNNYDKKYKIKNKLKINCLISGQRTGSTVLIDYMQKLSKDVLALSEIFSSINGCEFYSSSYDLENDYGILNNKGFKDKFKKLSDTNLDDYFKLFEDYAIYHNKKLFIFKYTIDFSSELSDHDNMIQVLEIARKNTIIYLDRNSLDSYISKKLADKYGYSNTYYNNVEGVGIIYEELKRFIENKKKFEHDYITFNLTVKDYIHYDEINNSKNIGEFINHLLRKVNDEDHEYLDLTLYHTITQNLGNSYFNVKQSSLIDYNDIKFT